MCCKCGCCGDACGWVENCFHKGVPVDIRDSVECSGTTIGNNIVNLYYWGFVRVIATLYVTAILIWSYIDYIILFGAKGAWQWFFFMTHWGLILNTTYLWSATLLHYKAYQAIVNKLGEANNNYSQYPTVDAMNLRHLWRFTLFILDTGLAFTLFIILLYYGLLYDPNEAIVLSYHTHGVAGGLVIIEWFTNTWQLTYTGIISCAILLVSWISASLIFYAAGFTNAYDGGRYIYSVVDWGKDPGFAALLCVIIFVVILLCHAGLVALKNEILKCWLKSKTENERNELIIDNNLSNNNNGKTKSTEMASI